MILLLNSLKNTELYTYINSLLMCGGGSLDYQVNSTNSILSSSRYVPKDNPPSQVFNVPWITVEVSKIFHLHSPIYIELPLSLEFMQKLIAILMNIHMYKNNVSFFFLKDGSAVIILWLLFEGIVKIWNFDIVNVNTKIKFLFLQQGRSNHRVVRLQKLNLKTSGIFTCEVSSEAPRFSTATGAGTMNVST